MSDEREANPLIQRVDALMKRQQEDSQRARQEVPLLTEVVEPTAAGSTKGDEAIIDDIVRVLLVRLMPEMNKQIADLRGALERELRKSARDAVAQAIAAARKAKPKT
jgi:hypothetical protein